MTSKIKIQKIVSSSDIVENLINELPAWQLAVFRFNEAVAGNLDIAATDLQCLFLLDRAGQKSPAEISHFVNLSTGAGSRMIERLLRAGMVTREHDDVDRRRVNVAITREAQATLHRLYDPLDESLRQLLSDMSSQTLNELIQFVRAANTETIKLTETITYSGIPDTSATSNAVLPPGCSQKRPPSS